VNPRLVWRTRKTHLAWLVNDSTKTQRIVSNPELPNRPFFMDAGSPVAAPGSRRTASASAVTQVVAGLAPIQATVNGEAPTTPAEQSADIPAAQQSQVKENYASCPLALRRITARWTIRWISSLAAPATACS
jgi:hypothetical protein